MTARLTHAGLVAFFCASQLSGAGPRWTTTGPFNGLPVDALAADPFSGWVLAATPSQYGLFRSRGPAQPWEPSGPGLEMEVVQYLAADRTGRVYATSGFLAFSSDDGGASWQVVWRARSPLEATVLPVAVHPMDPNVVYLGTCCQFPRRGQTVHRSFDRGATWTRTADLGFGHVKRLALHPIETRTLIASVGGTLVRSTDGFDTRTFAGLQGVSDVIFDGVETVRVVAAVDRSVFWSRDLGTTWETSGQELPFPVTCLAAHSEESGWLFAGTAGGGVFQSRDGGRTWSAINLDLEDLHVLTLSLDLGSDTLYAGTQARGVFSMPLRRARRVNFR